MIHNELIATFIGMQKTDIGWFDSEGALSQHIYDQTGGNCHDTLHFDTSWDWLMSVVTKIGNEFTSINISLLVMNNDDFSTIVKMEQLNLCITNENSIEAIYVAIVEFIKWYNKTEKLCGNT